MTIGIIPAAGAGTRIQPLAFSKELLPVGSRAGGPPDKPRAVSEYIVERMILGGATTICFVIAPNKHDILQHHGAGPGPVQFLYAVQEEPRGLCNAIFSALPLVRPDEPVLVGLPDTVWFPETGLAALPPDELGFLLFPVDQPSLFDAVLTDGAGWVREIQVKSAAPDTNWIWGAFSMPGAVFHELHRLWLSRGQRDEYLGTLVNAYLAGGGRAIGVRAGRDYVDVGTFNGYRDAIQLLREHKGCIDGLGTALPPILNEDAGACQATITEVRG
jgi:dTDP-glucose pyrophosphorylase